MGQEAIAITCRVQEARHRRWKLARLHLFTKFTVPNRSRVHAADGVECFVVKQKVPGGYNAGLIPSHAMLGVDGMREIFKLIPVVGSAVAGAMNAAAGFAVTTGVGEAACVWLKYRRRGETAPSGEVRRAFSDGLAEGFRQAMKQRKIPEGRA